MSPFGESAYLNPATVLLQIIMALLSLLSRWLSDYWQIHPDATVAAERERASSRAFCLGAAYLCCSRADTRGLHLPSARSTESLKRQRHSLHFIMYNTGSSGMHATEGFFFYEGRGCLRPWADTSNLRGGGETRKTLQRFVELINRTLTASAHFLRD